MRKQHVRLFGHPMSPGGARYFLRSEEDLTAMKVDIELAIQRLNAVVPTKLTLKQTVEKVRHEQILVSNKISGEGVPENLVKLIQLSKKGDVVTYCKRLAISQWELFLLVHNCHQLKFRHRSRFPEFIPPHLKINERDREGLKQGALRPFSKKITALMRERRNICVHLFEWKAEWHYFYFSYRDVEVEGNHWREGAHVHYISHLWPNITSDAVWKAFDTRATKIPGDVHVRFAPFSYDIASRAPEPDSPELHAQIATMGFAMLDLAWSHQ